MSYSVFFFHFYLFLYSLSLLFYACFVKPPTPTQCVHWVEYCLCLYVLYLSLQSTFQTPTWHFHHHQQHHFLFFGASSIPFFLSIGLFYYRSVLSSTSNYMIKVRFQRIQFNKLGALHTILWSPTFDVLLFVEMVRIITNLNL